VLHVVSSGGIAESLQPFLFMPLVTRLPKQRVKVQVVALSPNCVRAAVLRQQGVPVHEVALSRKRFALQGFKNLLDVARTFRPDVIQAWGRGAQLAAAQLRKRCDWSPALIWSIADTAPLAKQAGFVDRNLLKLAAKAAAGVDRIVYTSEAGAAQHRRIGFPEDGYECIAPGADPVRFKPNPAARTSLRERLQVPHEAFVIGMVAPFQPESDHATFLKGVAELVKTHPNIYVLLAGHGVQRGNAALNALIGSGALSTRIQLLGEWSDLASLFNACDLVCSSALTDNARMTLAMAMLCGIPCVATGLGAQGELIGHHGVAVEPGNPAAFVRGIGKILGLTPERRAQLAQGARKHALQRFAYVHALQQYLKLYAELSGAASLDEETLAQAVPPVPQIDANVPPTPLAVPAPARKKPAPVIEELRDPDSLETPVKVTENEPLPKWRIEQEQTRAQREAQRDSIGTSDGDVLQLFEAELAKPSSTPETPLGERARGYVEDCEDLLPLEALTVPVAQSESAGSATTSAVASTAKADAQDERPAAATQSASDARMAAGDTLPPMKALATLESASDVRRDAKQAGEPVQTSLFELTLVDEPDRKAVSG